MAASPGAEPFNTALRDGLKEALSHSEDGRGEELVHHATETELGRRGFGRGVTNRAAGALRMLARNPAAIVALIAVAVYFVVRKPSS